MLEDRAIVIGINRYYFFGRGRREPRHLGDGVVNDVTDMLAWLRDPKGGGITGARKIELLHSGLYTAEPRTPGKARPNNTQLDRIFQQYCELSERRKASGDGARIGRRLTVYMSGHGFAPGSDQVGLFTANATWALPWHHYATAWIAYAVDSAWFDEYVLWMDCCQNRELTIQPALPPKRSGSGPQTPPKRLTIYAAPDHQLAVSAKMPDGRDHGVFSYLLLEALRNGRAGLGGAIRTADLKRHIHARFDEIVPTLTSQGIVNINRPTFVNEDDLQFGPASVTGFPVTLKFAEPARGKAINIVAGDLSTPAAPSINAAPDKSVLILPFGMYQVQVIGTSIKSNIAVTDPNGETFHVG